MVLDKNRDKVKTARIGELLEQAKLLPTKPGCYLMKNSQESIIYIGKAKNLKNRVQSYFLAGAKGAKTEIMVSHVVNFEFIMTQTEAEALVLENNLIKQHRPKYNIRLKDDKSYPYVVVDKSEPFARLQYLRRVKRSSEVEVFGPFVVGSSISEVMKILTKSFGLRDCSLYEFRSRKEPCLLYQMRQCSAPCVGKISPEQYQADLEMALKFLRGQGELTLQAIVDRMNEASDKEYFELAAHLRDHHSILSAFLSEDQQRLAEFKGGDENFDMIAYYLGEQEIDIALCMVRNGLMLGHKNFHLEGPELEMEFEPSEIVSRFVMEYYSSSHDTLPGQIFISDKQFSKEEKDVLQAGVGTLAMIKVKKPKATLQELMNLTLNQAHENQRFRLSQEEGIQSALLKLQELLHLKTKPKLLECYDVAIMQGSSPTAAQIVFDRGKPLREKYRHFHLEERPEGNNDFAMMKEILSRRIKYGELPDVFIVDGGLGQINSFLAVLREEKIDIPVVGIAKSRTKNKKNGFQSKEIERSDERLIIPGRSNPYILSKCPALLRMIVHMRDEAHRFSRRLHHKQEEKRVLRSWLDAVPGVGPKTKQKILKNLQYKQEEILGISPTQLSLEWGVSLKIVNAIQAYLKSLED